MRVISAETSVRYHEPRNASAAVITLRGLINPIPEQSMGSERMHLSSKQRWQASMLNPSKPSVSQTKNQKVWYVASIVVLMPRLFKAPQEIFERAKRVKIVAIPYIEQAAMTGRNPLPTAAAGNTPRRAFLFWRSFLNKTLYKVLVFGRSYTISSIHALVVENTPYGKHHTSRTEPALMQA